MCLKVTMEDLVEGLKISQEQLKKNGFSIGLTLALITQWIKPQSEFYVSSSPTRSIEK